MTPALPSNPTAFTYIVYFLCQRLLLHIFSLHTSPFVLILAIISLLSLKIEAARRLYFILSEMYFQNYCMCTTYNSLHCLLSKWVNCPFPRFGWLKTLFLNFICSIICVIQHLEKHMDLSLTFKTPRTSLTPREGLFPIHHSISLSIYITKLF